MVICANTLMPELVRMGFFQELSVGSEYSSKSSAANVVE